LFKLHMDALSGARLVHIQPVTICHRLKSSFICARVRKFQ
jgi:hypothetical protein